MRSAVILTWMCAIAIIIVCEPVEAHCPHLASLTLVQKRSLVEAYRLGDHYGLGLPFAAIVFMESSACTESTGDDGHAYGCSQVHESAVYQVVGAKLPKWELHDSALNDVNMAIGARYLDLCVNRYGWPAGAGCYNIGLTKARVLGAKELAERDYTKCVIQTMQVLEKLPISDD